MTEKKHSHASKSSGGVNAWMVTTIILAVLLLLSMVWNGVLTVMMLSNVASGGSAVGAAAPTPTVAAPTAPTAPTPTQAPPPSAPVEVSADGDPVKGDENAPIEIIEFSDYECPFCARFYTDTLPQLESEYIDTGKVKLVFRDFPLSFHQRATPASKAAECVFELEGNDAYWEMHDTIFANQRALSDQDLRSYATQVGVDATAFDECYADADGSKQAEITKDFRDGQAAGVSGTPTFFINGQKIVGAQPFSAFQAAIDAALAAQ